MIGFPLSSPADWKLEWTTLASAAACPNPERSLDRPSPLLWSKVSGAFWVLDVPSRAVMGLLRLTDAVLLTDEANGADGSTGGLFCKGSRAGLLWPTDQDMDFRHNYTFYACGKGIPSTLKYNCCVLLNRADQKLKQSKEKLESGTPEHGVSML